MVTIKDVAKLAGVSPSTASRALHDNPMISPATRERVRQAMTELNYSPNFSAQNLVKQRSNTVAIVLPVRESPQILGNNPFFMQIIQGITGVCSQKGFMVSLATGKTEADLLSSVQVLMQSGRVDKFIFLYAKKADPVYQAVRENDGTSCIIVGHDEAKSHDKTYFVDTDNVKAGYDATEFLFQRGYQKPVFISTNLSETVQESRFTGYQRVMAKQDLPGFEVNLRGDDGDGGRLEAFLEDSADTDAFVCCDDMTAIYLIRLLKELERASSFGFISFNNSLLAELESPALTSVDIFPYDLGEAAANLLFVDSNLSESDRHIIIPHRIIERLSTEKN
ncbi:LacI family DNA-binding transcriptional regulator [Streptococcus pluranimalium]|uniref:LacI family transcriptional regulator n=1 Tax=Streptococcus pluranimalium TaxID=82348 RepID=A0A2L0D6A9_9STRE|nr:LacI family DNA-binding transcriptional regulator [Streptococcus pluranimalium]AUW97376.1 LacI family transcriptional regulator [Streptococcus pluranimalium]